MWLTTENGRRSATSAPGRESHASLHNNRLERTGSTPAAQPDRWADRACDDDNVDPPSCCRFGGVLPTGRAVVRFVNLGSPPPWSLLLLAAALATAAAPNPRRRYPGSDFSARPPVLIMQAKSTHSCKACGSSGGLRARLSSSRYRWAGGRSTGYPISRLNWSVSRLTSSSPAPHAVAVAAKNVTGTIPIVMATGGDPVGPGSSQASRARVGTHGVALRRRHGSCRQRA